MKIARREQKHRRILVWAAVDSLGLRSILASDTLGVGNGDGHHSFSLGRVGQAQQAGWHAVER